MRLIRCDNGHTLERTYECDFITDCDTVIITRNDLLIVRIWSLYEPCEDRGKWRSEAKVIVSLSDLEFFLGRKETSYLFKRLRRNNQISAWGSCRADGKVHARESMTICRHHSHSLRA